jgi:hypothetical protein
MAGRTDSDEAPAVEQERLQLPRHPRVQEPPVIALLEGMHYPVANYSASGALLLGYRGTHSPGREMQISMWLEDHPVHPIQVRVAVVRRREDRNMLAVRFLPMPEKVATVIAEWVARGQRAPPRRAPRDPKTPRAGAA